MKITNSLPVFVNWVSMHNFITLGQPGVYDQKVKSTEIRRKEFPLAPMGVLVHGSKHV
jgi:hypothetical protein